MASCQAMSRPAGRIGRAGSRGVPWSGSRVMLAGRSPADEQGDDDRRQVPGACAAGQPGGLLDIGLGVGGADTGDRHARGLGQVGQPVGARLHVLAGVGEQQPQIAVGLLLALGGVGQGGEQGVSRFMTRPSLRRGRSARPEGITWCGARVSRRTMSSWTSCAQRRLPSIRACRARQAAAISAAWASKSSAQIPARHQISARSPTCVGVMRSTRGSRPDRVCIRVSKQTRWMRWRDSTHQARRMMNRRVHGSAMTITADAVRMITIQATVTVRASFQAPAIAAARAVSSVRNRQIVPAAL